ncbi:response regulator, partial [Deltaproteobacteria bacterium PRO3]|nr:response regulator [Deltaproteobacteria bacterium PRO3]
RDRPGRRGRPPARRRRDPPGPGHPRQPSPGPGPDRPGAPQPDPGPARHPGLRHGARLSCLGKPS